MCLLQKMKKKIFKKMMEGNSDSKMLYSVGYNKEKKTKDKFNIHAKMQMKEIVLNSCNGR